MITELELDSEDVDYDDEKDSEIRKVKSTNPACEIFGSFIGASVGLCVPSLLSSEYNEGKFHLFYERLHGVSLKDLRDQLEAVQASIDCKKENASKVRKYIVSVIKETFFRHGINFSHDGTSFILLSLSCDNVNNKRPLNVKRRRICF